MFYRPEVGLVYEPGHAVEQVVYQSLAGDGTPGAETGDVVTAADGCVVEEETWRIVKAVSQIVEECDGDFKAGDGDG